MLKFIFITVAIIFIGSIATLYLMLIMNSQGGFRFVIFVFLTSIISYILIFDRLFSYLNRDKKDQRIASEALKLEREQIGIIVIIIVFSISLLFLYLSSTKEEKVYIIESKNTKVGRFGSPRKWVFSLQKGNYFDSDFEKGKTLLVGDEVKIKTINTLFGVKYYSNEYIVNKNGYNSTHQRW